MLLKALVEWGQAQAGTENDLGPEMYIETEIKWIINLDCEGGLKGIVPASGGDGTTGAVATMMAPHVLRGTNIAAKLLADNGEYVLGVGRDPDQCDPNVELRHEAFADAVRSCAGSVNHPAIRSVLSFLERGPVPKHELPKGWDARDVLTFDVEGCLPILLPEVRQYWAELGKQNKGRLLHCLVCNEVKPCPESHAFQAKGIRGGNPTGVAVSSANAVAFESYGLERSLTAPVCLDCGEISVKALNKLLEHRDHHIHIGPVSYIFWCRGSQFNPASFILNPQPNEIRELPAGPATAQDAPIADGPRFYAAALSANNSRLVVRDWIDIPVRKAEVNLARYFMLQEIAAVDSREYAPCSVFTLASATVREQTDMPAHTAYALLRFMFNGGVLPMRLLFEAVQRNRSEQCVTRPRAAIIKMVLLSQNPESQPGDEMVELDTRQHHPAYLSGRLLYLLGRLQRQAIGKRITSNFAERFYAAASARPKLVFPTLVRNTEVHFAELRSKGGSVGHAARIDIERIVAQLGNEFPSLLTLKEQGVFALGYYHQRVHECRQDSQLKEQQTLANQRRETRNRPQLERTQP